MSNRGQVGALATLIAAFGGLLGCGEEAEPGDDSGDSGGSAMGGTLGGTAGASGAGASSGGVSTGGVSTGGVNTGGVSTGGMAGSIQTGGTSTGGMGGAGGTPSTGGSAGSGGAPGGNAGSGGSGGSAGGKASGLPIPPGDGNVPRPSGTPGNMTVLDWAGFESAVSYTFDDSLTSQTMHYSELQATGVRMTFYIVSGNTATSATWTTAARDGHEIANHTAHHCHDDGTGCSWGAYAGSLEAELTQCTNHIEQTFGVSGVYTMAAPFGDGGWATAAQSQFFINRGVAGGTVAPNDTTDPFSLPCKTAAMGEAASGFNTAIDSAHAAGRWQILLFHSLGGDGGYNPVMTSDVLASVNHAKGLGTMWIDSVVNVGAYWRAQKVVAALTPTMSGMDRTWTFTLPNNFPPGKYLRVTVPGGTLKQGGAALPWDGHGYYEIALDAGSVTLSP